MNSDLLTDYQRRMSRRYLAYELFSNLWFISAIWLFFYRLFIPDQQVGILDGIAFAIGVIAEVPSGVLADRFGRDRLVKLGQLLVGIGLLVQGFGSEFMPFFVGQSIMMVGFAFVSGADEALFFEKLNFNRSSVAWRKLVMQRSQVGLIAALVATIAGGWMYSFNPRLPWILTGVAFIVSTLFIWSIQEVRHKKSRRDLSVELKEHMVTIKDGFFTFFSKSLWFYVPIIITVQGLFYASNAGLLRLILLDRFGFGPFWGALVIASSSLITVGLLALMHRYAENLSEKYVILTLLFCAAGSLFLSLADIGYWGYVVVLILCAGDHVFHAFMSEVLHYQVTSSQRATVLSVGSFLRMLPYVALAPIIGYLNGNEQLEYFLIPWGGFIVVAGILYLASQRKDVHLSMRNKELGIDDFPENPRKL